MRRSTYRHVNNRNNLPRAMSAQHKLAAQKRKKEQQQARNRRRKCHINGAKECVHGKADGQHGTDA
jgi:hypothetical protein